MNCKQTGKRGCGRNGTECSGKSKNLQRHGSRRVVSNFEGGSVTSEGGLLAIREMLSRTRTVERFAECFTDDRDAGRTEHTVADLLHQRVLGLLAGYEDLNDHDQLRGDPLLALAVGKKDITGEHRARERDRGKPLASRSTLNRLELGSTACVHRERYKRITYDESAIEGFFVQHYLDAHTSEPDGPIILDVDATNDRVHGNQGGRFFHAYYNDYIYLPLYIFAGDALVSSTLNTADKDPGSLACEDLERVITAIRAKWPNVQIIVRGDSGFCRDEIMKMCEDNGIEFVLGLAKNSRLIAAIEDEMEEAASECERTGEAARRFKSFAYQTRKSWSTERRVVGKAECLPGGPNPRFVVTSLEEDDIGPAQLYERLYCARGDMENRLKEQQLGLFADRTSSHYLRANQFRLWLSSLAYVIFNDFRRLALKDTELQNAQVPTVRSKLFKIGAIIKLSVRRVVISFSSFYPFQNLLNRIFDNCLALDSSPSG